MKNINENDFGPLFNAQEENAKEVTPTEVTITENAQLEQQSTSINVADSDDPVESLYPKMPKLPPVLEMIARKYPKNIRKQVVMASLPIFGTYGTHIRFRYLDNQENSLSFMVAVVGRSASGKSFSTHLFNTLSKRMADWDAEEREKGNEYQKKTSQRKPGDNYIEDPRPKVRIFGEDITSSQMLEYLDNLGGEHALWFTEEVHGITKARKSRYSDNDDMLRKSFDNGTAGKESKSSMTRNIRIRIFLNTLFSGTPSAMHAFYNNPEGGLNNRIIFAMMPNLRQKGIPCYGDMTEEEQKLLDETLTMLWHAGSLEEEEGQEITDEKSLHQGKKEFKFAFLDKAINKWIENCDKEDDENPNDTWRELANRAAVIGYRAGVLMWFLWGRPTEAKKLKHVKDFAIFMADSARNAIYAFCGEEYDRLNSDDSRQAKPRNSNNKKLFSALPEEFTREDILNMKRKNGEKCESGVRMIVLRWKSDNLIVEKENGKLVKLKSIA